MNSAAARFEDDRDDAIQWIVRLRSHDVSDRDRAQFVQWMADPAHVAAFDDLLALWDQLACVSELNPDA
jgi:transmembrane sensor